MPRVKLDGLVTKEEEEKKKKWEGGGGFFFLIFFIDFRHHVIRKPGLFPFPFPTEGKHCVAIAPPPVGRALTALRRRIKITGIFKAGSGIPAQADEPGQPLSTAGPGHPRIRAPQ